MQEGTEEQRAEIIRHLKTLNEQVERQMTLAYVFRNGIVGGIGFIVGSTVLTALVVTFVLEFAGGSVFADVIRWIAGAR